MCLAFPCIVWLICIMSLSRISSALSLRVPAIQITSRISGAFHLVNRSSYAKRPCFLDLPNDILVDRIFLYLEPHEVLRLRRVCAACSLASDDLTASSRSANCSTISRTMALFGRDCFVSVLYPFRLYLRPADTLSRTSAHSKLNNFLLALFL